ncbi:MAG TPA: rhodanese-like domain-containing protein [Trueperaceae bacterium]
MRIPDTIPKPVLEVALALLLAGAAGLGFYQLNRPLPAADALITTSIADGVVVLDARGSLSYRRGHIPGAEQLWSRNLLSFTGEVAGALARPEALAEKLRALGLTPASRVVVYDDGDGQNAPLVLLVLHAFGLDAKLLLGGLEAWRAQGGEPVRESPPKPTPSRAEFHFDDRLVVNAEEAREHLAENAIAPVDTREPGAYRAQHIAKAVNLSADTLLPDGQLPRWSVLHNQLQRARITMDIHPFIYGSDISEAARAWLALRAYGIPHMHIYRAPYQGLVQAGLPVSHTESIRATSTPSSSVCWQ